MIWLVRLPLSENSNVLLQDTAHSVVTISLCVEQRDGHGQLRNSHGKVREFLFAKSVGTLFSR